MMGFGMGAALPQHDSWAGAIWGGTKQAAKNVWNTGAVIAKGEVDIPDGKGGTKAMDIDRGFLLKNLPGAVSGAFRAHTFSLREPEKFQQLQDQVAKFQGGRGQDSMKPMAVGH
jgi:hypothetical protein